MTGRGGKRGSIARKERRKGRKQQWAKANGGTEGRYKTEERTIMQTVTKRVSGGEGSELQEDKGERARKQKEQRDMRKGVGKDMVQKVRKDVLTRSKTS